MKSIQRLFSTLIFVLLLSLAFTACKKTSDEGSTGSSSNTVNSGQSGDDASAKNVTFGFTLTGFHESIIGSETSGIAPENITRGGE